MVPSYNGFFSMNFILARTGPQLCTEPPLPVIFTGKGLDTTCGGARPGNVAKIQTQRFFVRVHLKTNDCMALATH